MEQFQPNSHNQKSFLILNHLLYARRLSKRFYYRRSELGIEHQEFQSAAYLGLCDAAQRYDDSRGLNFETFSYFRIRGAMYDLLRRGGWFYHGAQPSESENSSTEADAAQTTESSRRTKSYSRFNSMSFPELASLLEANDGLNFRLHSTIVDGETHVDLSYANQIDPETFAMLRSSSEYLRSLMDELPQNERDLIHLYYFEGLTLEDIRKHFNGASKSWLSRMHKSALARLRAQLRGRSMHSFEN